MMEELRKITMKSEEQCDQTCTGDTAVDISEHSDDISVKDLTNKNTFESKNLYNLECSNYTKKELLNSQDKQLSLHANSNIVETLKVSTIESLSNEPGNHTQGTSSNVVLDIERTNPDETGEQNNLKSPILNDRNDIILETFHIGDQQTESNRSLCDESSGFVTITSSGSIAHEDASTKKTVLLYASDLGPKMYNVKCDLVTSPLILKNFPEVFSFLPVYGRPDSRKDLDMFLDNKLREFIGCDINDEEFESLTAFCSTDQLRTGKELKMEGNIPVQAVLPLSNGVLHRESLEPMNKNLSILKKSSVRRDWDSKFQNAKKLKYRSLKLMPLTPEPDDMERADLEPGKDILVRVRVYRPFVLPKDRAIRARHSLLNCDVVLPGRMPLTALRDRIVCANDADVRLDISDNADDFVPASAKELFPSGFLFINNAFYVDTRAGCRDLSGAVRAWALRRRLGAFPRRSMTDYTLDRLVVKLGYPEVYVHQGNCEHLFTFSEIRLLNVNDPLKMSHYPTHTAFTQYHTVYCTTCAEFGAKWIVVGCNRVPFDPAFFCDTCFRLYLYKDGKKLGDFKAYSYRCNEINMLKPSV